MKVAFLLAAVGASLLVTSAAGAAKRTFTANISPDQENAGTEVGDHDPTGAIKVTFDDVTKELCGEVSFTDLTGIASGVHVHRAPTGDPEGDSLPTDKVEIPPTASPVHFNIKLSADFEKGLNADELYVNVHTVANPKGELRSETPWTEEENATPVPCPPATVTPTDAGAPKDAGSTTSSSSSGSTTSSSGESSSGSTSGDDDDDSTSSSGSTSGKDAGAAAKKKDEGGCSTTGDSAPLSFIFVLGVGIAAVTRSRRKSKR